MIASQVAAACMMCVSAPSILNKQFIFS